jgi:hypothetical protein
MGQISASTDQTSSRRWSSNTEQKNNPLCFTHFSKLFTFTASRLKHNFRLKSCGKGHRVNSYISWKGVPRSPLPPPGNFSCFALVNLTIASISTEQSASWKVLRCSASQGNPNLLLRNPEVHYFITAFARARDWTLLHDGKEVFA